MATPKEKLANSLEILTELQDNGRMAIQSKDLTRTHRERLLAAGFLQEVMKGWYIISRPTLSKYLKRMEADGIESGTPWQIPLWVFGMGY